jgi:hypothetical protein
VQPSKIKIHGLYQLKRKRLALIRSIFLLLFPLDTYRYPFTEMMGFARDTEYSLSLEDIAACLCNLLAIQHT